MSDMVVRFSRGQRVEHFAVMVTFTVLCLTGLPQKFFQADLSVALIQAMGGLGVVRWLHRFAGLLFAGMTALHLFNVVRGSISGRLRLSLVVDRQDFRDAITTLKYYLGLSNTQARFGRYDYRQKFEYWGMILGSVIVIGTGFVLLYPITVAAWLPAQIIPAAKAMHSQEGLLAFLTIVIWHIYNAHLNPDVFPFDPAIFTGKISRHRMMHEHPLEYEEKFAPTGPPAAPKA
ncbi:MAG: formate dehydrogenase subunit gamma [Vicinamibacterales bacterium]